MRIRDLDRGSSAEIDLVAARMRETMIEVLGEERGASMHSIEWLRERVRFHLARGARTAAVFVAEADDGHITGHTIVRVDVDPARDRTIGYFSTVFVEPAMRRGAIATRLVAHGEAWMRAHGQTIAVTHTGDRNEKLIRLFEQRGYVRARANEEMVALTKDPL